MRKRKGGNLQISSTMVFFPLYFIMDSGYTNEVSVYKLYLLGVNLSAIGRVLGQAFLRTTSPSRLRRATSPGRGGFGSPRKVNGFARGSPTRGNGDDHRQRRKQGVAVGAAASRMQATAHSTINKQKRRRRFRSRQRRFAYSVNSGQWIRPWPRCCARPSCRRRRSGTRCSGPERSAGQPG